MAHRQDAGSGSIDRPAAGTVLADYAVWLAEQPLSSRTREAYLAAVTAFVAWLEQHDAGPRDALVAPRARDLAARDYERHVKVDRGLSPASVNQELAGMDNLFGSSGSGRRSCGARSCRAARRARWTTSSASCCCRRPRSPRRATAIVALLLFTGLRLSEAAAMQVADVRISARKGLVVVRSGKGDG
jgi:site-specific recombinase XerD